MTAFAHGTERIVRERAHADALLVAMISCAAAALHVSAAVGHVDESALYGIAFVTLAAAQVGWGCLVAGHRYPTWALRAGVVLNGAVVLVWVLSRTVGLPVGPDLGHPEAIGIPDTTTTVDELALIALCLLMLRGRLLPERVYATGCLLAFATLIVFSAFAHVG